MTMQTIQVSEEEAKTRELFNALPHTDANIVIGSVFKSQYLCALLPEHIQAIGDAMYGPRSIDYKKNLTRLTRAKILRSRKSCTGKTLYEVNF